MSEFTVGQKGLDAVRNKDFAGALPLLDKALESSNSPTWLLARAHAHQQLKNWEAALHDAELAYHTAAERGSGNSRKLMIEAQYRRSVCYFKMGRHADADCCAKWSMLLAEGRPAREDDGVEKKVGADGNYSVTYDDGVADKAGQPGQGADTKGGALAMALGGGAGNNKTGFEGDWRKAYVWRSQVLGAMKDLPEDHPGRKVAVKKIPSKPEEKKKVGKKPEPVVEIDSEGETQQKKEAEKKKEVESGPVPEEKLKLRVDFYQSNQTVTVSLFAKDVKKDNLKVEFGKDQVRIGPVPREALPNLQPTDREAMSTLILGGEIDPSGSKWSATPRKIELVLQKAQPGVKWGRWGVEQIGSSGETATTEAAAAPPVAAPEKAAAAPLKENTEPAKPKAAPAYPTSSKSGPKDWDKLGEGEDDDAKEDVNYFFKKLYAGSTPEQQRAMMKSFIESNGTALSTDWNDVKSRKVETVPPEGVEAKKWDD
ncbi:SGS domain-containing protein [Diplogelasinospora grovesii]|uniref:SGS domain-containing protein n=1 Tax=Diplogelasinospora grovesii TaxID=303347 RepID=A0AAN6S6Q4_9PEZI|nr:SGS domain-containing protein [Diplogelasinospora grovesii]